MNGSAIDRFGSTINWSAQVKELNLFDLFSCSVATRLSTPWRRERRVPPADPCTEREGRKSMSDIRRREFINLRKPALDLSDIV